MTDFTHSLAIVIGIDAYGRGVPPLTTAVNDAGAAGRAATPCAWPWENSNSSRSPAQS